MGFSKTSAPTVESLMQTITSVMREMVARRPGAGKVAQNKFIHKKDIFAVVSHMHDQHTFEAALDRLLQDGTVYTSYDNDILTLDE